MDFEIEPETCALLEEIDAFIEDEVRPLESRTTTSASSTTAASTRAPTSSAAASRSAEWEDLLEEMVARADRAGLWRYALPEELGGRDGSQPGDGDRPRASQPRSGSASTTTRRARVSMIGNFPTVILAHEFGTPAQRRGSWRARCAARSGLAFGLTEPEPRLRRDPPRDDGAPATATAG